MSAVKDNHVAASSGLEKYKTTVILRDGSTLYLRPIQREDEERLLALFSRLSPRAICLSFHHVLKQLPKQEARRLCTVDYENAFALVATVGEGVEERIVAVGRYYRPPPGEMRLS
jgi:hypothetical protein